ncbi:MAG TPA: ABC transporter permease subunit [Longimicrobiales bacterium]
MISVNLLRRLVRRNRFFLVVCALSLGLFQMLICAAVSTLDVQAVGAQLLASLPPMMQAMFGQQMMMLFTPAGLIAFGWNHPITIALGAAVALATAARAVAGEVESGAIELLLAQPMGRGTYLATQLLFGCAALAFVALGGLVGSLAGQLIWQLPLFQPGAVLALGLGFWLVNAACYGFTFMLSAFGRETGRVAGLAFIAVLVSYLLQAVGRFWSRAAFLLPWSIFERYTPRTLLTSAHVPMDTLLVLGGVLLACVAVAWLAFARRDLP